MRISSVNVGRARSIERAGKSGRTGIFKESQEGSVRVGRLGLEGDEILDTKNHGGLDQAVYLYGEPDYEWWSGELGYDLSCGVFGENLTLSSLSSADYRVGDRFLTGEVVLEVTAPRIPCSTLAARMGDPGFVKRFRHAERPGIYCRVIREGELREGEEVVLEPYEGETVSIIEMFRDAFDPRPDEATLRRHLAAPVAVRDRVEKEKKLRELLQKNARGAG